MDIRDTDGKWRLANGGIENCKTGEFRLLQVMPKAGTIAHMNYDLFMRKCQQAFSTGVWPKTHWASGNITD